MLDKSAKGIIAQGDPRDLQEHSSDPRVVNFFNRRPTHEREDRHG
jgi:phospholipid/cholesterol/gamma-HCH transport system ATP-binding protein